MENLFKVTNVDGSNNLDLFIFDVIDDFWGVGKTAILNELQGNKFDNINLQISSPGGSVDDAFAMYDLIKGHNASVTANLSGIVASAATVIALSADKVIMSENSLFMIHNASVGLQANKEEMAEAIDVMEKFDNRIANIYQKKTGLPMDEIKDLMTAETWFTPEEALAKGFIDEISEEGLRLAAKFDLDTIKNQGFKNIPNNISEIINMDVKNGASLISALESGIERKVSDDTSRGDVLDDMASAAGISRTTVNGILNGTINCPPLRRIEGFSRALDVSLDSLLAAGDRDGCGYSDDDDEDMENAISEMIINNNKKGNMEVLKDAFNAFISTFEAKGVEVTEEHKALISEVENSINEKFENALKEAEVTNAELTATIETLQVEADKATDLEVENNSLLDANKSLTLKVEELEGKKAIENSVETPATPEADANVEATAETVSYLDMVAKQLKRN